MLTGAPSLPIQTKTTISKCLLEANFSHSHSLTGAVLRDSLPDATFLFHSRNKSRGSTGLKPPDGKMKPPGLEAGSALPELSVPPLQGKEGLFQAMAGVILSSFRKLKIPASLVLL